MLFNSFDFIFLVLPVTLAAFAAALRLRSSSVAVLVLLVASYVFYGYGDHFAVLLLAGSTAFNYVTGPLPRPCGAGRKRSAVLLLGIGICGDLAPAGVFQIRRLSDDESRSADRRCAATLATGEAKMQ